MCNRHRHGILRAGVFCLLAGLAAMPVAASAANLQIDPVKLEITAERKIASIRIRNDGDAPVTIHGSALSWSQQNGQDVNGEVSNVIVSPPVFTIPAGQTQLVRVGLRSPDAAGAAYRLILEEVPQARPGGGVQVALRLNVPLFAMEKAGAPKDLSWAAWRRADNVLVVEASNRGTGYVRVEPSEAGARTGIRFSDGALGVVLPGGSKKWVLTDATVIDRAAFDRIARAPVDDQATPPTPR
jgi:fimbrial chaperone protein